MNKKQDIYQIYDQLSKSEYTFLLCRIKNMHMMQYLYGKECKQQLYDGVMKAFLSVLHKNDYAFKLYSDHFILYLKTQDPYIIIQYIYAIDHVLETLDLKNIAHALSLSYGIFFMRHDVDFYEAYDHAKFAMHNSKDLLKYNTSFEFCDPRNLELAKLQFKMQADLEKALNNHEFEIYLQSKVDAKKYTIKGCEALIRWVRHGNEVPLKDFMPMIDRNAFIRRIDLFVFEEVCKLLTDWKTRDIPLLPVSLNISKASFEDGFYYLHAVEEIFQRYTLDKDLLEFELSENICFQDTKRLHYFVYQLYEMGFTCSLDDFGSGYSSFFALSYLPVSTIKLDSAFSLGIWDKKKKLILKHLLALLHEMQLTIVVEGVETQETLTFLQKQPCDLLQGFYFCKPMCVSQFEQYYLENS